VWVCDVCACKIHTAKNPATEQNMQHSISKSIQKSWGKKGGNEGKKEKKKGKPAADTILYTNSTFIYAYGILAASLCMHTCYG